MTINRPMTHIAPHDRPNLPGLRKPQCLHFLVLIVTSASHLRQRTDFIFASYTQFPDRFILSKIQWLTTVWQACLALIANVKII